LSVVGNLKTTSTVLAAVLIAALVSAAVSVASTPSAPEPSDHSAATATATFSTATTPTGTLNRVAPGRVKLGARYRGRAALLVPVRYPLEISGRKQTGRLSLRFKSGDTSVVTWTDRPQSGGLRAADRRRSFRFVHAVVLSKALSSRLVDPGRVRSVSVSISVRLLPDLPVEPRPSYRGAFTQSGLTRAAPAECSDGSLVLTAGAGITRSSLPRCGSLPRWRIATPPSRGEVTVDGQVVEVKPAISHLGSDSFRVRGSMPGRGPIFSQIQVRSGTATADSISVRALGDSVTAGFGYFGKSGRPMTLAELIDCRPGATVFNDACSSNSSNRNSAVGDKPNYLPDYGLSRNISWAAQWANEYGITDYRNYAVTGSAPSDWLPAGQFHDTLLSIQQQNPDYIVLTLGANPLLSNVLFGIDNMGCALESDLFGDFSQCVRDAFETVDLDDRLNQVYSSLVANTSSKIVVMKYHLSIPATAIAYSAVQLEVMGDLLNEVIADEAAQVSAARIAVVTPPRFDVGINMTPVEPADFSCSWLGFRVDGPSVQSDGSQDELLALHPLSFCEGPALGPPWVIDGDTGIHPSAAGYSQMAGQMPAPG
jgi:lysophospholipase L1-like esterase